MPLDYFEWSVLFPSLNANDIKAGFFFTASKTFSSGCSDRRSEQTGREIRQLERKGTETERASRKKFPSHKDQAITTGKIFYNFLSYCVNPSNYNNVKIIIR